MIEHFVGGIFHFFQSIGLIGAFLSMFIENIGVPLPTEIGYLISQDLINQGKVLYPVAVLILTAGHIAGSLVSYLIGRASDSWANKKLRESSKIKEVHRKVTAWYKKYGNVTVFLTRFVGYVRPWSSFVAGFAQVPFWPFLIWTSLGSLIFNIITLYFTEIVIAVWRRYSVFHVWIILAGLILFSGLLIYELFVYFRKKVKRRINS